MSKGRYAKKKKKTAVGPGLVIALALVLALLVGFCVIDIINANKDKAGPGDHTTGAADSQEQNPGADATGSQDPANTPGTTDAQDATNAQGGTNGQGTTDTTGQGNASTEPQTTQEPATQPTVEIGQMADAEYEKWLAAAQIICVSMEYPDFRLEGVYAASATSLEDKYESDGVYIVFTSGDEQIIIHSVALDKERTEAGTYDISSEAIGLATFDRVEQDGIDVSAMQELVLDELSELISQSLLVTIYMH